MFFSSFLICPRSSAHRFQDPDCSSRIDDRPSPGPCIDPAWNMPLPQSHKATEDHSPNTSTKEETLAFIVLRTSPAFIGSYPSVFRHGEHTYRARCGVSPSTVAHVIQRRSHSMRAAYLLRSLPTLSATRNGEVTKKVLSSV
jgi:hypothetical protein